MAWSRPDPRWFLLAAFGLLVATTQITWLSYAPITTQAGRELGVSEAAIGDLAATFPLVYVLLALPTGRWLDARLTGALAAGAGLTAAGAVIRAAEGASYAVALAGQLVLAVAQPLVLNASTKLPARYFPPGQRTVAISVASAAQFVGILVSALTGEPLWRAGGLRLVLAVHAGVALLAAGLVVVALRVARPVAAVGAEDIRIPVRHLLGDPLLRRLAVLLFIGVGAFNALATWLDPVLSAFGLSGRAGPLIALMTAVGIAGAVVLPGIAARTDRRRGMLLVTVAATVLVPMLLAVEHHVVVVAAALAVLGFVLLAGLPIILDWSELESGPQWAGMATAALLLAGNLGGVILVLVVQLLLGHPQAALLVLGLLAAPGLLVAAGLPRRARRHGDPTPRPTRYAGW